jgi:putative membrane protein
MTEKQKDIKLFVSTIILVIIHIAGVIGIHSPLKDLFLMLTPFNLIMCITLLFINHQSFNKLLFIFCFITFIISFFIEVVGVRTGVIFGNYTYGGTLGLKVLNVPIIIGANWMMLTYCVGVICNKINTSVLLKSLLGSSLLVMFDFVLEPVAIKYNYWNWNAIVVPFQNYVGWFVVSFLFLLFFNMLNFTKNNRLAQSLFIIQFIFFILLGLF